MLAVKHNHLEVVEFLVENTPISINARNSEGNTALLLAVENQNFEICECLMR
jgi:ankyrin repeat protein